MRSRVRQSCILFAFQPDESTAEVGEMICRALGETAMTHTICKNRRRRFRDGDFNLDDREMPPEESRHLLDQKSPQTGKGITTRQIAATLVLSSMLSFDKEKREINLYT